MLWCYLYLLIYPWGTIAFIQIRYAWVTEEVCAYIYKTYNKPTLLTQLYINTWASWGLIWKRICLQYRRLRFDPEVRKIPWRREWLPTPVFWPGESHGQRSLVGYHAWCRKESDTTEWLTLTILIHTRERESVHVSVWEKVLFIQRLLSLTARNKVSWKATKRWNHCQGQAHKESGFIFNVLKSPELFLQLYCLAAFLFSFSFPVFVFHALWARTLVSISA